MEVTTTTTLSFMFLVFLFLHWWLNRKSPAIHWPLIGMTPSLIFNLSRVHELVTRILKQSGGTLMCYGPWFTNVEFLLTSDPMNLHHILSKNAENYPKGDDFHVIFEALGDGIFNSDAEKWRIQRKILHSIIGNRKFEDYSVEVAWQKVETGLFPVLDRISELGIELDMQDLFSHLTFDASCLTVLGVDPGCLSVDHREVAFEKAFDWIEKAAFYRNILPQGLWKLQKWLGIGIESKRSNALKTIDQCIYQYISLRKEELSKRKFPLEDDKFDILSVLLSGKEHNSDTAEKSDKFLRDTAFNLLSAGRDTVGAGLTWLFWYVATNPSVENKILKEIESNLEIHKCRPYAVEELNKLVYLHGAICEALRLHPPVPFNRKVAAKHDTLPSGHRVARNTKVTMSFYTVGRMEEVWGEDCLEFKPERWISKKGSGGVVHVPSYKFTAFNAGPRTCLGKDLSFVLMKIAAIAIICNYKIQCVEGHQVLPVNSVVLHMKYGLKVRVRKRSHV